MKENLLESGRGLFVLIICLLKMLTAIKNRIKLFNFNKKLKVKLGYEKLLRYHQIYEILELMEVSNLMEIGTWDGMRAYYMIKICQKKKRILNYYGFDLFEGMDEKLFKKEVSKFPPTMVEVEKILALSGAGINLYKGFTSKTLPKMLRTLPVMDFIFIDGGHSLDTIGNDWYYASKLTGDDSVVVFDDYWEDNLKAGCRKIIEGIDRRKFDVQILPHQDVFKKDFGLLKINLVKVTLKHE